MAMTPEAKVKKAVKTMLEKHGAYFFSPQSGIYGASGQFDIIAVVNGQMIGIETKKDCKTQPTGLQSRNAKKAIACGVIVLLIHDENIDVLDGVLQEVLSENNKPRFNGKSVWPFDGVAV
jgi:hypothetical protein